METKEIRSEKRARDNTPQAQPVSPQVPLCVIGGEALKAYAEGVPTSTWCNLPKPSFVF